MFDSYLGQAVKNSVFSHIVNMLPTKTILLSRMTHLPSVKYVLKNRLQTDRDRLYELFFSAMKYGLTRIVKIFIDIGIDVNQPNIESDTDYWSYSKFLPLHYAIINYRNEIVKLLIKAGADVNLNDRSQTPLSTAILKENIEAINILLDNGADPNKENIHLYPKKSPIFCAISMRNIEIIEILINAGADLGTEHSDPSNRNTNAYQWARRTLPVNMMRTPQEDLIYSTIMLNRKKRFFDLEKYGFYPLHIASRLSKIELMNKLLDDGYDINKKDKNQVTPLMLAVKYQKLESVELLIERGANKDIKDKKDKCALFYMSKRFVCNRETRNKILQLFGYLN